jgi:hypothetical protein
MAPSIERDACLEAEPPRPSSAFQVMEDQAIQLAKSLHQYQKHFEDVGESASVKDAMQITELVAKLARKGKVCSADQVNDILCRCEVLIDVVATKVSNLLAKTK